MNILFAHAGEVHEDTKATTAHLLAEPFIALPMFILIAVGLFFVLKTVKVSGGTIMISELALFLAVGIATYRLVPVLAIFSLTTGITAALLITLASLAQNK
jgi:hypothetical protein